MTDDGVKKDPMEQPQGMEDILGENQRLHAAIQRLAEAVAEMRHAQKEYFRTKSQGALNNAKRAEHEVDDLLEKLVGPRLF